VLKYLRPVNSLFIDIIIGEHPIFQPLNVCEYYPALFYDVVSCEVVAAGVVLSTCFVACCLAFELSSSMSLLDNGQVSTVRQSWQCFSFCFCDVVSLALICCFSPNFRTFLTVKCLINTSYSC